MEKRLIYWLPCLLSIFLLGCQEKPYSKRTINELITNLNDKDSLVKVYALSELGDRGEKAALAMPHIIKLLKDQSPVIRYRAAETLRWIGKKNKGIIPEKKAISALIKVIGDKEHHVRVAAIRALIVIGPNQKCVPSLIEALKSEDSNVRMEAASALGIIGTDAKSSIPILAKLLYDKDSNVWPEAALAILKIAPNSKWAIPALILSIKQPSGYKEVAAKLCANIGPRAIPHLLKVLATEKEWWIRESVIEALGNIGPEAKKAIPAIKKALTDKKVEVREAAKEALKKIQNNKQNKNSEKKK